jgi:putative ABC transport system substrate-binding protein
MLGIRRREFITLLCGAAATRPLAVSAQQRSLPVIGYLGTESPAVWASRLRALHQGLAETSYAEGRNVVIEYRWADGQNDRLPGMAAELVRREVSVIIADNTPAALAAKAATTTIPIIFYIGLDPVTLGLVASLSRPGGNVTGVTGINQELGAKRLELLHELLPTTAVFATIVNPGNPSAADTASRVLGGAAQKLGVQLHVLPASSERDFDAVFAAVAQLRAGGLVIGGDSLFNGRTEQLATLALRYAVPTIYQYRDFAEAGGLMSYGGSFVDWYRLIGIYVGRILKGEKPADLPVQQATKVELILNLKTAEALGLTVPLSIRLRADEVIE